MADAKIIVPATGPNLHQRLVEFHKDVTSIKKSKKNAFLGNSYFDINDILETVKPVLNKHGILLFQALTETASGGLGLATTLANADNPDQIIGFVAPLPPLDSNPQKAGSAITYFRRYALQALLALEAEDDDGNSASGVTKQKAFTPPKGVAEVPVKETVLDLPPADAKDEPTEVLPAVTAKKRR